MVTCNRQLESIVKTRFAGIVIKAWIISLMLFSVIALLPALSQADGLFDFQMKLAEKGNAEAEFKVGEMYETGFGVKQDMTEAQNWIKKAADKGHETANYKLLYWDLEKNGVTDANKAKLASLQTKAIDGDAQAQFYVGKMFSRGVGVKKDPDQAISWLNKAALVGILEAEREVILVREEKQRQALAQRRAEEKKRAELKAQQERDRQAKLEQQRKLEQQQQAEAKARVNDAAKQDKAATEARLKAEKAAAEKQQQLAKMQAEEKQREAQKQALLKKREADEQQRKTQFESDPCSGKSARFLSTCK